MINVTVSWNVKSEKVDEFVNEFKTLKDTVRKEDGCIKYVLTKSVENSDEFFMYELWESKDALLNHLKTKHMVDFFSKTKDFFATEPVLKTFETKEFALN